MGNDNRNDLSKRLKQSRFYRSINAFASSAIIGLAITLIIFIYKVYSSNKQFDESVDRLNSISHSLSTRCLGKFPAYISEINDVFSSLESGDTVIIFEDVLYYGIKRDPVGFSKLQQSLLNHSRQGGKVIVAYYDNHARGIGDPWKTVFHRMILESRISPKYLSQISLERHNRLEQVVESHMKKDTAKAHNREERRRVRASIDSCVTEEFFVLSRDNNIEAAQNVVNGYLSFMESIKKEAPVAILNDPIIYNLCNNLDSIMYHYLANGVGTKAKQIKDIHFADYEKMYSDITDCIAECYKYHGIELVPLNEYLTMSCWLIKPVNNNRPVESILAFPSKYTSDEIGFYSQDEMFSEYIETILNGVRGYYNEDRGHLSNF